MADQFEQELPLTTANATLAMVDVVESVRQVASAELLAVQRIRALLARAARETVPAHQGRVVERQGDGLLLWFNHPRHAVSCAAALHRLAADTAVAAAGTGVADGASDGPDTPAQADSAALPTLLLRVGLHCGPVLTDQTALYGTAVNLCARIAALGLPGDTLVSSAVRDQLAHGLDGDWQDLGLCHLKHFDLPVRLFKALPGRTASNGLPPSLRLAIAARMKLRPTLVILPTRLSLRLTENLPLPAQPGQPIGLADIVTDQLSRQISQTPLLHVISPLSANGLRGRDIDLSQLYRDWHADYVLQSALHGVPADGTACAATVRLTLDLQLWRAGSGEPVHRQSLRGSSIDLLSAASDMLGLAAQGVCQRILAVEQRAARQPAMLPNLSSHTLYLNAVDLLHRFTLPDFERARQMLTALHDRAPRHAEPLAWLARWHVFRVVQGWTDNTQREGERALDFSQRALDRDPQSSLALTMAGSVTAGIRQDPAGAQLYYDQALRSNPSESLAWLMRSVAQGFLAERAPALAASETALGLAPIDPTRHYYDSLAASASVMGGEFERGIALARRCLQANATHGSAYRAMATAQVMLGRMDDARATVDQLLAVEPHCTVESYLARVGPANAQNLRFAQALQAAGLPTQ